MKRFTQKQMVNDYERLYNHSDLLELYLYDTQTGCKPDAVECHSCKTYGKVRIELYRTMSASGGYVVIQQTIPNIWRLDDALAIYGKRYDESTLGIRECLDRLRVHRQRRYDAQHATPGVHVA